jgi:16S rRNA (guanine(1405)-N(7))-methyltransferase
MAVDPLDAEGIAKLAEGILASPKYRAMGLLPATVQALIAQELPRHRNQKQAVQAVREKLHNVAAPYLGDPDYPAAARQLETAFGSAEPGAVKAACAALLASHASTRERLSILDTFYPRLFAVTGQPASILDLACALNPLTFPWMGLPNTVAYRAYDIHQPRVAFLQRYFELQGLAPWVEGRDILIDPPTEPADVAFFFKEAHRFEQRQHGCNRAFWQALNVRWLLVSLPPSNLTGRHSLAEGHRHLVYTTIDGLGWQVTELMFANEMVFCIKKE